MERGHTAMKSSIVMEVIRVRSREACIAAYVYDVGRGENVSATCNPLFTRCSPLIFNSHD